MTGYRTDGSPRVRIEQAIARGDDPDLIVETLGVDYRDIDDVVRRLDEVNGTTDDDPVELSPHGTHAAFVRHRNRGEEPCPACRLGERAYDTEKHRRQRSRRREQAA